MTAKPLQLTLRQRWAWRRVDRRVRRDHESEQMTALRAMAAGGLGVTGVTASEGTLPGAQVEMIIAGRRLRAARMSRRAASALREAVSAVAAVPLTTVGRYGPYWVLTFRTAAEPLVVLADRLTLLPEWGGPGGRAPVPVRPVLQGA
jgi:hypothetical protein